MGQGGGRRLGQSARGRMDGWEGGGRSGSARAEGEGCGLEIIVAKELMMISVEAMICLVARSTVD